MTKGTDTIVKNTLTLTLAPEDVLRPVTPIAFRRQERFWDEVKRRIQERRPAADLQTDRLY
jgi:hypothetical protein